jgi:hypothetical protein
VTTDRTFPLRMELLPVVRERWGILLLIGLGAGLVGAAIVVQPRIAIGLVVLALIAAVAMGERIRLPRWYLVLLGILLIGYALMGRGFAYLGLHPVYPGEAILVFGVLALLLGGGLGETRRSPVTWAVVAFAAWGAWCTWPYVDRYSIAALRDATLWAYGGYAILTAGALLATDSWRRVPSIYARALPWLLVLLPAGLALTDWFRGELPRVPGSPDVGIFHVKPGDLNVHLSGIAVFLLLGLHVIARRERPRLPESILWAGWLVGFVLGATQNRGGMLAAATAFGIVLALKPTARWIKFALPAVLLIGLAAAADFSLRFEGRRETSVRQLLVNAGSLMGLSEERRLEGTVEWRKQWWLDIVDYTVFGPYRWSGKGFGVNLADDDGYQVEADRSLRSPHSIHMTVLARMGLPGFALWVVLQGVFAASLLIAYFRARAGGLEEWARLNLWLLAFWAAFLVNASFDVFLEGPMGGIWFWSVMGFGIAVLEAQRRGQVWTGDRA